MLQKNLTTALEHKGEYDDFLQVRILLCFKNVVKFFPKPYRKVFNKEK